mmetsp:Transcript_39103/g.103339  ORF Transcript_39103/g.103339 Transcript_39103/m.103339 type:complete len:423 (-) Transcript_39103:885-2153(-)
MMITPRVDDILGEVIPQPGLAPRLPVWGQVPQRLDANRLPVGQVGVCLEDPRHGRQLRTNGRRPCGNAQPQQPARLLDERRQRLAGDPGTCLVLRVVEGFQVRCALRHILLHESLHDLALQTEIASSNELTQVNVHSAIRQEGLVHLPGPRPGDVDVGLADDLHVAREVPGLHVGVRGGRTPVDVVDLEVLQQAPRLGHRPQLLGELLDGAVLVVREALVPDQDDAEGRLHPGWPRLRHALEVERALPEGPARVQLSAAAQGLVRVLVALLPVRAHAHDGLLEAVHNVGRRSLDAPVQLGVGQQFRLQAENASHDALHLLVHARHSPVDPRVPVRNHEAARWRHLQTQLDHGDKLWVEAVPHAVPNIEVVHRVEDYGEAGLQDDFAFVAFGGLSPEVLCKLRDFVVLHDHEWRLSYAFDASE